MGRGILPDALRWPLRPRVRPMNIIPEIAALDADMRSWRHHLHAHPETAFEETATSARSSPTSCARSASTCIPVSPGPASSACCGNGTLRRRDRPARRPRRAAHPREVGRAARVAQPRQDARVRPRRPHDDAARGRERDGAAPQLRRHAVLHLPAGRGERGRRPRDGRGGAVRPVSGAAPCTACTTGRDCRPARSRCARGR